MKMEVWILAALELRLVCRFVGMVMGTSRRSAREYCHQKIRPICASTEDSDITKSSFDDGVVLSI